MNEEQLRYAVTGDDQVEAFVAGMADTDFMRRGVRKTRILIGLSLGMAAAVAWYFSLALLAGFYLAAGLLGVAFSRKIATWDYRRQLTKAVSRDELGIRGQGKAAIVDEGLRFDSDAGSSVVNWPEIKGVYEAEHTYVLRMSGTFIVPIPKETESGDAAAFITEVRSRTGH